MAQPSAACVRRSGAAAYANRKIRERKGNVTSRRYSPARPTHIDAKVPKWAPSVSA